MGIQKYVFFSIHNCDKHPEVPLMEIKYCTEKFLQDSGINHVVIRLCGFMQVCCSSRLSYSVKCKNNNVLSLERIWKYSVINYKETKIRCYNTQINASTLIVPAFRPKFYTWFFFL